VKAPRQEAIDSLEEVKKMLKEPPTEGVRLTILRSLVDYAQEQVLLIQEVKRVRKPKA
jgi:hypothetical protein